MGDPNKEKPKIGTNLVTFENVNAGGDVVGGDKNEIQLVLPRPSQLDLLYDEYKEECEEQRLTNEFTEELTHYKNRKSEVRDLTQKLTEAGFDYLIDKAEELKEVIAKLIVKFQHYKSAQKALTFLLSEVESLFNSEIKPRLTTANSEADVMKIFRDYLECEIQDKLGANVFEIYYRQINGMVYFLTGNCHLEWANAPVQQSS